MYTVVEELMAPARKAEPAILAPAIAHRLPAIARVARN